MAPARVTLEVPFTGVPALAGMSTSPVQVGVHLLSSRPSLSRASLCARVMKVNMLCSLRGFWGHTTELSLFCFEPWAKCDSAVTRANVLKTHNESKLAGIKRRCDKGDYVVLPLRILGTHNRAESVLFLSPGLSVIQL